MALEIGLSQIIFLGKLLREKFSGWLQAWNTAKCRHIICLQIQKLEPVLSRMDPLGPYYGAVSSQQFSNISCCFLVK